MRNQQQGDSESSSASTEEELFVDGFEKKVLLRTRKIVLSREQILDVMHLSQSQAAKTLGVSVSTLKRRMAEVQLRWPRSSTSTGARTKTNKSNSSSQKDNNNNNTPTSTSGEEIFKPYQRSAKEHHFHPYKPPRKENTELSESTLRLDTDASIDTHHGFESSGTPSGDDGHYYRGGETVPPPNTYNRQFIYLPTADYEALLRKVDELYHDNCVLSEQVRYYQHHFSQPHGIPAFEHLHSDPNPTHQHHLNPTHQQNIHPSSYRHHKHDEKKDSFLPSNSSILGSINTSSNETTHHIRGETKVEAIPPRLRQITPTSSNNRSPVTLPSLIHSAESSL